MFTQLAGRVHDFTRFGQLSTYVYWSLVGQVHEFIRLRCPDAYLLIIRVPLYNIKGHMAEGIQSHKKSIYYRFTLNLLFQPHGAIYPLISSNPPTSSTPWWGISRAILSTVRLLVWLKTSSLSSCKCDRNPLLLWFACKPSHPSPEVWQASISWCIQQLLSRMTKPI